MIGGWEWKSSVQPDGGGGLVKRGARRREDPQADHSIHRTVVCGKDARWLVGRACRDFLSGLLPRWLGLTKIAIAIEKKVAKQLSAYHLW
jgi:hypothetical protein